MHWKSNSDLAPVQDPAALRLMPDPAERAAWERLWAEVETVVRQPDRPAGS